MTHFAREYGNALFELAREEHREEAFLAQLAELTECFRQEPDYIRLLCTRSIEPEERKALLDAAFADSVHPYVLNFMKLLTGRGAMDRFIECADVFRDRYNELYGVVEAEVTSAAPLSEDQINAVREKFEAMLGRKLSLRASVDPSLIGGLRVDVEGRRYDNSIRTRLERMRRSLIESE